MVGYRAGGIVELGWGGEKRGFSVDKEGESEEAELGDLQGVGLVV